MAHTEPTAEQMEQVRLMMKSSPAFWADKSLIRLANGQQFSFENRAYLIEPMNSTAPVECSMKATGGGFSECQGILPTLHGMINGRYPQGVAYYFPTDTDMQAFVKTRFNPLIKNNHAAIGKFCNDVDSADVKRIANSNLFLRGPGVAGTNEEGKERQSSKTAGIHVDRLVVDEVDKFDKDQIAKMRGRLANSAVDGVPGRHEIRYIANPSDEDMGIDTYWQNSDQRFWFSQCESCGSFTDTLAEFINDPEKAVGIGENGRGYMKCAKCGKPLGFKFGKYVPKCPSQSKVMVGYHWSHLVSAYQDPLRILHDYRNPPEGNFGDVMRLDLGLAYSAAEDKLRKDTVLACCGNDGVPDGHPGPCAMGVDNDDGKHYVIGIRTAPERYALVRTGKVDDFKGVYDLLRRYGVRSVIVDLRPNADSAREFAKAARAVGATVYLAEYTDSPLQDTVTNEDTGIIKIFRTGAFDASHRIISNGHIRLPRQSGDIDEFAQQCCNCVKRKEENAKGQVVYRYKKTDKGGKGDHLRNALNYFLLAATRTKVVKLWATDHDTNEMADANYARI
jgi:hypothetical protein